MTVSKRTWKAKDGSTKFRWAYDFTVTLPDGTSSGRIRGNYEGGGGRREAEAYEARCKAEVLAGRHVAVAGEPESPPPLVLFRDVSKAFLADRRADVQISGRGGREADSREGVVKNHLDPFLGADPVGLIDAARVKAFSLHQATLPATRHARTLGYSPKSIFNQLSVLRQILAFAVERGDVDKVPAIPWPELKEPTPRFYTFEESARLVEASKAAPYYHSMILVALRCGLRLGELRALQWQDVDFRTGVIRVERAFTKVRGPDGPVDVLSTPKNGKVRAVPMSPQVAAALKAHTRRLDQPWVWGAGNGFLRENEIKHPMWRALDRAGLPRDGWHICRHTFCSHLVQLGVHLLEVQALAGHETYKSTLRYAHLAPHRHAAAVALLDEPADGPGQGSAAGG